LGAAQAAVDPVFPAKVFLAVDPAFPEAPVKLGLF